MENKITLTFKNNKLLKNTDTSKINFKEIKGKLVTLKEGEILYREGETSEYIYLIVSGEVKIIAKDESDNSKSLTLTENDFFGHVDFYESTARKTSAFGIKDSYLIAVSKAEMNNLLWQDVTILQNLKTLCSFDEPELDNNLTTNEKPADLLPEIPDFNSFESQANDEFNINLTLEDDTSDNNNINIDSDSFKLEDFNTEVGFGDKNIELTQTGDTNLTDNLPEFLDDEEPENIEMSFSEDLLINQLNTTNFISEELTPQTEETQYTEGKANNFNVNSDFYKQFEQLNTNNLTEDLEKDNITQQNNFSNKKDNEEFNVEGFTSNNFSIIDDFSLTKTEETENDNFLSDFNSPQLNEYPKSFEDFNGLETIKNTILDDDIKEKDLLNTDLGALRFEDDDIIKPEGDIEELEQLEGFDKEQFLKSEFEELYKKEDNVSNYEDAKLDFNMGGGKEEILDLDQNQILGSDKEVNLQDAEIKIEKIEEPYKAIIEELETNEVRDIPINRAVMNIEQLKMILKAAQLVSSKIKLDDVLQNIVSVATNLTNCDRGTLYLVDKEKDEIWSKIAMGNELKEIRLKIGDGVAGWVAKTGEIVNITDAKTDSRFKSSFDKTSGYQTKSMICYPIKNAEGEIIGVHQLLNSRSGMFNELDEEFLNAISIHASIALENAELVEKLLQFERISSLGKMANFLIQDIKNPVLISKKYAEHLKNKNLPQDVTRILDMILEQLNQVADLVLTTSNYSEKNKVLRQINTNIISVLNDYTSRIDSLVHKKNCTIVNKFDVDALVRVDLKEFYQGYQHIIKNAAEAMPDGGTITVTTEKEGTFVKISIKDNGLGIPDSIKDKIFDPFMSHGKKEGTGLGLSITKKIIQEHGGTITAISSLGQGSTFIIKLPIAQDF